MENQLKTQFRKTLYRNRLANKIFGLLQKNSVSKSYRLSHLSLFYENKIKGSLQQDEALFLYSLIRMLRPKVIIEFGFLRGHSALNFLYALDRNADLYSYDIDEGAKSIAETVFKDFKNFHFIFKSQLDFAPKDIENKKIDLIFYDAVWDTELNLATFERFKSSLSEDAIIILHDTNTWRKKYMNETHYRYVKTKPKDYWLNEEEFQQQKGQREFYNAFLEKNPEYCAVNIHTENAYRNGITLLQKKKFLPTK